MIANGFRVSPLEKQRLEEAVALEQRLQTDILEKLRSPTAAHTHWPASLKNRWERS